MPVSLDSFGSTEPNWRYASQIEDGRYGLVAFMDHYAYKARENRDFNLDYDFIASWEEAFSEGYLLHPIDSDTYMTEEEYESETDPDYGMDPVFLGPYFLDQNDFGGFTFHGPTAKLHGPKCHRRFTPTGCTRTWWVDESLYPSWIYP